MAPTRSLAAATHRERCVLAASVLAFFFAACTPSADEIKARAEKEDRSARERAAKRTADRTAKEKEESAKALKESQEASEAKKCPTGGTKASDAEFRTACKQMIKQQLKTPSSADFPGMFDEPAVQTRDDCSKTWSAWVDGANDFGGKRKQPFTCSYDPKSTKVSVALD